MILRMYPMISYLQYFRKKELADEFAELYIETVENLILLIKASVLKEEIMSCPFKDYYCYTYPKLEVTHSILIISGEIFTKEKDPIELIKWKVTIENMENAMDRFERIANTVDISSSRQINTIF